MIGQGGDLRRDFFRDKAVGMALEQAWESPKVGLRGWVMPLYCLLGKAFNDIHNS